MIALFEVTIGLIFWFCYSLYKNHSNKKYKEKLDDVASNINRWFATREEIDEFRRNGDSAIEEVSSDMTKLFGDNWKEKFVWHYSNSVYYNNTYANMAIGWDAVGILYFAKRGKITCKYYKVTSNRIDDNIVFFKYIESLIQKQDSSMRMIFEHDMVQDLYESGKYHVNEAGSGKLVWECFHRNFHDKYVVSEYLW